MYLNQHALKTLEEIASTQTKSNIVKAWARKYCINEKTLAVIWRRAELLAAKGKKCKCIPWGTVTDIFKLSVRKHFKLDKCNRNDIKPAIIRGKLVKTHKDVEPGGALVRRYKAEIKKLEKECPNFDKLPDCLKSLNEALLYETQTKGPGVGAALGAAALTGAGVFGLMHLVGDSSHDHPISHSMNDFIHKNVDKPNMWAGKY